MQQIQNPIIAFITIQNNSIKSKIVLSIYECSCVKTFLIVIVVMQMNRLPMNPIDMFAVQVEQPPESVVDSNGNDNYVPKKNTSGSGLFCWRKPPMACSFCSWSTSRRPRLTSQSNKCK